MAKPEKKQFKMAKDNAAAEFNRIVEAFNFNISTEAKESIMTMKISGIEMSTSREYIQADSFIQKIMIGRIEFDAEKCEIVYKPESPVLTGENKAIKTTEFRFGKFNRAKQKGSGVPLNECNFATMKEEDQDKLLMALTGISDENILNNLAVTDFNDLRMIGGYFFD